MEPDSRKNYLQCLPAVDEVLHFPLIQAQLKTHSREFVVDSIRRVWNDRPLSNREFYAVGTWGPVAADDLLAQTGHRWHEPVVLINQAQ